MIGFERCCLERDSGTASKRAPHVFLDRLPAVRHPVQKGTRMLCACEAFRCAEITLADRRSGLEQGWEQGAIGEKPPRLAVTRAKRSDKVDPRAKRTECLRSPSPSLRNLGQRTGPRTRRPFVQASTEPRMFTCILWPIRCRLPWHARGRAWARGEMKAEMQHTVPNVELLVQKGV